jgi:hypothetical protein
MSLATKVSGTSIAYAAITGTFSVQTVVGLALYDAATAGTLKWAGLLDIARPIAPNDSLTLASGVFKVTLGGASGGVIGDAEALANLDADFGAGTPATYYFALMTAMPTGAGGGTEFTLSGSSSYVRTAKTNNATNFPNASMV